MRPHLPVLLAASAAWLLVAAPALAGSSLRLPMPQTFATIDASTYDGGGERVVGAAHLLIERLSDGRVKISTETGFAPGPRTVMSAMLAPVPGGGALRPLWQESRSFQRDGTPMGLLRVDHEAGRASCVPGPQLDWSAAVQLDLPRTDRVANVPLNLLFQPLVDGEAERVDFQFFLCGGGPRLLDFRARVGERRNGGPGGRELVEIRYGPDFGTFGSMLLAPVLPRLSIWFDPHASQPWLAHRVPLYSDGPEVLVVRDGIPPGWLAPAP
jgi:hypothetical protein